MITSTTQPSDRFGMKHKIYHPYMEEGTLTNQVELADLALHLGQKMTFDFGDSWEFNIQLEGLDPSMEIDDPILLEAHGEAPEQYPYSVPRSIYSSISFSNSS